jgi:hypothetical protein
MLQFENIYSGDCEEYCRLISRNKEAGWSSDTLVNFPPECKALRPIIVLLKIKWTLQLLVYNASVLDLSKSMFLETKSAEKEIQHWNKGDS